MSDQYNYQLLHWGIKVTDLKETLRFMVDILGMHILKHSEMDKGCSLNCNGPYDNPWSKTMIGYGEEEKNFVFEVAYNYGKHHYKLGNDTLYYAVSEDDVPTRALHRGIEVKTDEDGKFLKDPTGLKYVLVPEATPRVHYVAFAVSDLAASKAFYVDKLGLKVLEETADHVKIGVGKDQAQLLLIKSQSPINHEETASRLAIGAEQLEALYKKLTQELDPQSIRFKFQELSGLPLFIITDPDGYEICLADKKKYIENSKPEKGDALIDWDLREKKEAKVKA